MKVVKRNRRFYIETDEGRVVYTPPDFLRPYVRDREKLRQLAESLQADPEAIKPIIAYESALHCTK